MALQTMYPASVNSIPTTLQGAIGSSDTVFIVLDDSRIPDTPNLLVLGDNSSNAETVRIIAKDGTAITVERGFQGMARAWSAGTTVARNFTAYDHDTFKANIENLDTTLTAEAAASAEAVSGLQNLISAETERAMQAESDAISQANAYTDSAMSDANAYTDTAVANEAQSRADGDNSTLAAANQFATDSIGDEAGLRAVGDADTLDAAKDYTDAELEKVARGTFSFVGYVSTSQPAASQAGELWINAATMPTAFPVTGVQSWNGTAWVAASNYGPTVFDLWSCAADSHGYYWFGNSWNLIDADVDMSVYYTKDQTDALLDGKVNGAGLTFTVNNGILQITYDDGK